MSDYYWTPSKEKKTMPYFKGKKQEKNWYNVFSSWFKKNQDGSLDKTCLSFACQSPKNAPPMKDGSPRPCDILRAVVHAWDAGSDKDFGGAQFYNKDKEGKQPDFNGKVNKKDYEEFLNAAGQGEPTVTSSNYEDPFK